VDIRESSKLAEKLGQRNMTKVYHIFSKITAKAVNEIGGRIIQFAGDGFLAAFTDSAENNASKRAYACIEKIQMDLKETYQQSVDKNFHFSCGYGIAYGHIYMTRVKQKSYKLQSFGIFPGHATNMSSKLCDIAEPNQLIIDINSFQQIKPEKYKTNILYGEEVFLCQV
jgi:class 3 adenylate cyclase